MIWQPTRLLTSTTLLLISLKILSHNPPPPFFFCSVRSIFVFILVYFVMTTYLNVSDNPKVDSEAVRLLGVLRDRCTKVLKPNRILKYNIKGPQIGLNPPANQVTILPIFPSPLFPSSLASLTFSLCLKGT